ncbi:MAG: thiamine phosphate synthase [Caulobacteraceae bacterium]
MQGPALIETEIKTLWRISRRIEPSVSKGKLLPPVLFFTDPERVFDPERALRSLPRGAGIVFRHFGAPARLAQGRRLAMLARRRGIRFFVGADVALAIVLRSDGVHLTQRQAARAGMVRILRRRFLVTAAAHHLPAIRAASRGGVDALVVSPVFPSRSRSAGHPIGVRRLAALTRRTDRPVYALGGVNQRNVRLLLGSGVAGVAAVDALTPRT